MTTLFDTVYRLEKINKLILNRNTGTPEELAKIIHTSKSQLFNYLKVLTELGVEIKYNRTEHTYEYTGKYIPQITAPIKIVEKV